VSRFLLASVSIGDQSLILSFLQIQAYPAESKSPAVTDTCPRDKI